LGRPSGSCRDKKTSKQINKKTPAYAISTRAQTGIYLLQNIKNITVIATRGRWFSPKSAIRYGFVYKFKPSHWIVPLKSNWDHFMQTLGLSSIQKEPVDEL
jgi:hypothetical protein